jgi:HPt (histidine-containing phosphotransfer) domain-containing protein
MKDYVDKNRRTLVSDDNEAIHYEFKKVLKGADTGADIREVINWGQLIDRLGDEEIVREIMPTYIKDTREHFDKLSRAVESGDCESIASHAHALKGVGRNLSVERLADIACQMEGTGRKNDIESATLLFDTLKTEIDRVLTALSQIDWVDKAK